MTDLREAAKLALEALEPIAHNSTDDPRGKAYEAIAALKRALAEDTSQQRVDKAEEQRHEPNIQTQIGKDISPDLAKVGEVGVWGEPVAWIYRGHLHEFDPSDWATEPVTPLYTRPQQCPNCVSLMEQNTELDKKLSEWVGLTDDEIALVCAECAASAHQHDDISFARAIEATLKEKNT